ncbi:hypothetical protein [Azospirillum sp. B21]|uniref:hypothetical protein n=1 Tax=Azospirillum sp. B21 TaxID=2607496 RepID=UPI00165F3069|nr:hypothetical protein [Azospirillum sp. B21]
MAVPVGIDCVAYLLVLAGLPITAIRPRRRGRLPQGPAFAKEKHIERRLHGNDG